MYMTIRSRMSSVMELVGPELFELSALELENLPYLKEFNYECNRDRIVKVICPLFKKKTVTFDFVYTLSSAYIDQSAPNWGKIFMSNKI